MNEEAIKYDPVAPCDVRLRDVSLLSLCYIHTYSTFPLVDVTQCHINMQKNESVVASI